MDQKWWEVYADEVAETFSGLRLSICTRSDKFGAVRVMPDGKFPLVTYGNSGAGAIMLAKVWGAARVVLLGYDCQRTQGKAHWHGDHPERLGNAGSLPRWGKQFDDLAQAVQMPVVNCSRETALTVFPRQRLEDVL